MMRLLFLLFVSIAIYGFSGKKLSFEFTDPPQDSTLIKKKALIVLEQKCNACHLKKKKVVFTEKNMNSQARPIHYQVFVKKRMPKGKVKLTSNEFLDLKKWLNSKGLKVGK